MSTSLKIALAFVSGAVLGYGVTRLTTGPSSYDDCVIDAMRGGNRTETAAALIIGSCRTKFPEKEAPEESKEALRALDLFEVLHVTGRAGVSGGNYFSGSLYNGADNITVTEIDFDVSAVLRGDTVTRTYRESVRIPPLSTSDFGFDILAGEPGSSYSWRIRAVKGWVPR